MSMLALFLAAAIQNPAIDMRGYLAIAGEAAAARESHRVSEEEFIRMSAEPGAIVLDARSRQKFVELHIRRAINLSFPDITIDSLREAIPDRDTRILIYCNNNFTNAPGPFPSKLATASLNLSTYIALYTYGYRNVFELAPLIDIRNSKLTFCSSAGKECRGDPDEKRVYDDGADDPREDEACAPCR